MKAAVIGIGSNSVRSLVAEVCGNSFTRLARDREGTRLFAGLDEAGNLSEESIRRTVAAVTRMAGEAREQGAAWVNIFATSAARDAANGAAFTRAVQEAAQAPLRIISGEEEAELSFLGASAAAPGRRCGVIDIGGGSTEIAMGEDGRLESAFSCQMGAVRLYQRLRLSCREDMIPVQVAAGEILAESLQKTHVTSLPDTWVGTGGTFTTLAAMALQVPWTDRTQMHGAVVSREDIGRIGEQLAETPVEERKKMPGLQPGRADIVVHGICILLGVMDRLGLQEIMVSEWGNLEGYLRKYGLGRGAEAEENRNG